MTIVDASALLAAAIAAHNAGQLDLASQSYQQVLAEQPDHPTALHLLGLVDAQQGRLDDARARIERVVLLAPAAADAWTHLATVHRLRGDLPAEAAALDHLLTLQPDQAQTWGRRGVLAFLAGELEAACAYFARAVELASDSPDAWTNLGAAQLRLGRLAEAEASQRRAVAADPTSATALNNLGNVLVARSRWDEAATTMERFVRHVPGDANGWINFGHALKGLKRYEDAQAAYERALSLRPDDPAALLGLGDALQGLDQPGASIPLYERALVALPDSADTFEHLGVALQTVGRLDDAIEVYGRCLAIEPERVRVHSGLIFALDLKQDAEAEARDERRRWNARFGRPAGRAPIVHLNGADPERPLRVGYVSADFRHHSAAYSILPVLRAHDRAQVSVVCYSGVIAPDRVTAEIRGLASLWRDVAELTDDELAAQIRADQIDILVDLSGHSAGNRLPVFAQRPAPVQVTAWGYAASTGLEAIDYFLADPISVPVETRANYAESVLDLPSILCYEPPAFAPEVSLLPSVTRGYVTFGAFNRLPKISDRALATWGRLLAEVPTARLMVKCPGADVSPGREWLLGELAQHGVHPDRVILRGSTPHAAHLAAHADVDLMLDTFPQNGGITTLDALAMGVPLVTLLGTRVPGRASASFLTTIGLDDLVAKTTDEYVAIAARLAGDLDRLVRERATLRARLLASPLADARLYTRAVETAYRDVWRRWCADRVASRELRAATGADARLGRRGVVRVARAARRVEAAR